MKLNLPTLFLFLFVVGSLFFTFLNKDASLIPLYVAISIVISIFYYFAYISKTENFLRFKIRAAFVVGFALLIFVGSYIRLDQQGISELSKYITPYPNISQTSYLASLSPDTIQHWNAYTSDSKSQIELFYSTAENTRDWKLVSGPPIMIYKKSDLKLVISVIGESSGSTINYQLRRISP